ncbi:hypothetical protein HOY80DRAFT_993173 [Tuber brumale]|nr:hypothetical protein HOY80DRAFT_993173 [Tuber brumale]
MLNFFFFRIIVFFPFLALVGGIDTHLKAGYEFVHAFHHLRYSTFYFFTIFSCFLIISSLLFFFFFASLTLQGCPLCLFLLNYSFVVIAYDTFQCSHAGTYPPCLALFPILFL